MRAFHGPLDPTRNEVPGVSSNWDQNFVEFVTSDTTQTWVVRLTAGAAFQILWGDGSTTGSTGTGIDQTLVHNYAAPGTYDMLLQVANPATLIKIDTTNDGLTGAMPDYGMYPSLTTILCGDNALTGHIPDLGMYPSLMVFDCGGNNLDGPIPSDLGDSVNLTSFVCHDNALTGHIPELTGLTALSVFDCSTNNLDGPIPTSIGDATNLTDFQCYANAITGSIPSLTANTLLSRFDCSTNQLTGVIPSLTANIDLITFECHDNLITGYTASVIAATCVTFNCATNSLTEAAVDQILADFATGVAGRPAVGSIILNGVGNAYPSAAGLASKAAILAAKPGWTITVNSLLPTRPDMSTAKLWYKLEEAAQPLVNFGDGGLRPLTLAVGVAPTFSVPGTFGNCIQLPDPDTNKCGMQYNTDDSAWFGHGCTVWAWITPESDANNPQFVFGNSPDAWYLSISSDRRVQIVVEYSNGSQINTFTDAGKFNWGDLVFIAATNDGANTRVYVNGVEQANRVYAFQTRSYGGFKWTLGSYHPALAQFKGQIHDCGFDDTVYSAPDLLAIYHSVVP